MWKRNCPKCNKEIFYNDKRNYLRALNKNPYCRNCYLLENRLYKQSIKWCRKCPQCFVEIVYKNKPLYVKANKRNSSCNKCKYKLITIPVPLNGWMRKCPMCNQQITYKNKRGMDFGNQNDRVCKSCSSILSNEQHPRCNPCSDDRRRKARIFSINRLNNIYGEYNMMITRTNPISCKFIDEYSKKEGYNFQHALNGGEYFIENMGYYVDGYDKEKNIVFEYDEPHHYYKSGLLKFKDIRRMNEIKQVLKCKFIRYNEKYNKITEY
jgi:hypothetical protein